MSGTPRSRLFVAVAALQLLGTPLRAGEPVVPPPPASPTSPSPPTSPAPVGGQQHAPAPAPEASDDPVAAEPAPPATKDGDDERVSVDNNLSFPVDI